MTVGIAYVDGSRLARARFAAADWVAVGRDELNRINVYPVPDGDTGTNFSLTLRAVADALPLLGDTSLPDTARTMARAAVLGARGNSGMLLAHYLLGFSDSIDGRDRADVTALAGAMRDAADGVYESLDNPREGTILTVARDAAAAGEYASGETPDIATFVRRVLEEGRLSLARTPDQMPVLREAGVVANEVRAAMHALGGSVQVALVADVLKIHVHTDRPESVYSYAAQWDGWTRRRPKTCGRSIAACRTTSGRTIRGRTIRSRTGLRARWRS